MGKGQWKRAQREYRCWGNGTTDHPIRVGERYYARRDNTTCEVMRFCETCFDDQFGCTDAGEAERQRH